ncbi:MAG: alanine racemase, partial [Allobaculum sp.]|nr:alanine racemase [Allobaculum sp.]
MKESKTLSSPIDVLFPNPSKTVDPTADKRAWAEVDYQAIAHNIAETQKLIGNTKIMGIVKADAYGHGALACAQALRSCGIDFFAVACLQEAQELREGGIEDPILILGYTPPASFPELARLDLTQSLLSNEYAKKLAAFGQKYDVLMKGHVKVDTGMNRTGILYQDNAKEYEAILEVYQLKGLDIGGLFS